ncbi:MAG: amidohydrolase family protein [Gemmatimonadota bacterium]
MNVTPRRYAAPWVLPIEGPPIPNGAVLIGSDGRIVSVGPDATVPALPGVLRERIPDGVILPGLINTHTHLELTGLDGQDTETEFPAWIARIIALKAGRSVADYLAAARRGIQDCWAAGVTTIADTGDSGAVIQAMSELGGSGIAYHEVFGPRPDQVEAAMASAIRRLAELSRLVAGRVRLGLSPHAPYSVSGPLYTRVAALAADYDMPLAVHIAESLDESLLLEQATGGFARAWEARGIPLPALPGSSPIRWLDQLGVLGPQTLCIHAVRASNSDLDRLAARRVAIAHCPRSNQRHGHGTAPLRAMLDRGLRVGVGTDSVASVSPLDLLAEARAAQQIAGLDALAALRLVTRDAARALGLEAEIGGLVSGKWGDLAILTLPGTVDAANLMDTVLTRPTGDVYLTVLAGREVYRRGVPRS